MNEPAESRPVAAEDHGVADAAAALANALAVALRTLTVYPAAHPRAGAALDEFTAELRKQDDGLRWLKVQLRRELLVVGEAQLAVKSPLLRWLCERMRGAGLCGIEFGPGCTADDLRGFAAVMARRAPQAGQKPGDEWPRDHPRLRVLDLVFLGDHLEGQEAAGDGPVGSAGGDRSAAANERRGRLLNCLGGSADVQRRLLAIEDGCTGLEREAKVDVDLLAVIADLLPVDIASDDDAIVEIATEILDRVNGSILQAASKDQPRDGAELMRAALHIAKRYLNVEAPRRVERRGLPAGRPADARIDADLDRLLAEYRALPSFRGVPLEPDGSSAADSTAFATELLGIQLYTLAQTRRPEAALALRQNLGKLLGALDPARLSVLDAYLLPPPSGQPTPIGDRATLRALVFLDQMGQRSLIGQRGYCPAQLVQRTFPESLPIVTRILGGTPRGRTVLSQALSALAPALRDGGAAKALAAGVLSDEEVIEALVGVGGGPPLPLLAAAAGTASGRRIALLLDYARTLPLPAPEAAVLRVLAPEDLPPGYLRDVLGAALTNAFDDRLRAASATALRTLIARRRESLSPDRLLAAIDSLREFPGAATRTFLQGLARAGWLTRWSAADRGVRRHAARVLATLPDLPMRSP